jgi:hypothetical protein
MTTDNESAAGRRHMETLTKTSLKKERRTIRKNMRPCDSGAAL